MVFCIGVATVIAWILLNFVSVDVLGAGIGVRRRSDSPLGPVLDVPPNWREQRDPAIATLWRECAWSPKLLEIGCGLKGEFSSTRSPSQAQIVALVRQRAEREYRFLWSDLTDEERLLCIHMAQGHLANPRNAHVVERLLELGLLRRDPDLQLFNRSFAQYVLHAERPEQIEKWENAVHDGTWESIRTPLAFGFFLAIGFIAYTQRALFETSVGLLTAVATGIPALLRAWDSVRQGRRSSGP
jgi:hypothetical protein